MEEKKFFSIEFKGLNVAQMLFVQAVVMPELMAVITNYVEDLKELKEEN